MKHDLTASSCCPGVTLLSRELLESNTPSENPKYETDVKELLKDKKNRKDIVTAVNTFVQGKLNTLATKEALSSFNETVKSKKLLNKLVTDEHYLVMNNSGLQVVDSKKDIKGKPIDLDKRSHRKLVGKYLSYLAKDTKALNTDQKQAASDLVSYIEELNALADEHSLAVDQVLHKSKRGKELREVIMNSKNTYKELNKSVAKALNKDLNLDSTKYSYLEAGTFDGLKISEKEVQANEKIAVVKDKLEEALEDATKVTLPSGVTYTIGKTELINAPLVNAGSYTAEVDLKEDDKPLGKLTLTVDQNGAINSQTGKLIDGYKVTLADGKLTVKTEAQAQEDKKSDKIKTAIANNIILPTVDTLTSTVTLGSKNATGSYDTATAEFKAADGTSLGKLTLTVDPQGNIADIKDGGTITDYKVTLTDGKLTVSKKVEEEVKTEIKGNNGNAELFTGLTPPAGKKILDLKDKDTKTKLEAVFTAIGGVSGYEKIIVNNSDEDGGAMNLDATIKAFQAQYMVLNKSKNHIGGKSGQPDGKIGPKTLAAMREVLGVSDTSDQGGNDGDINGDPGTKNQPKENRNKNQGGSGLDGTEESPANSEKNKEKLKKEYECLFDPKDSKSQCGVEIENQTFDSFNLHMSSGGKDVIIKFTVTRDNSTGKITEIRAKDHINDSNEFHQSAEGDIFVAPRGNGNNIATYKINKNKKEFLVGYDAEANDGKGKRLYDVVDIDEKLKNEYLGLFKKYNDNNNQYNVEVSNPTNNSFIIKLTKDGTTIPFTFNVNRNPNNNNKIEKIDMKVDDIIKNPYERNYMDGKNTYWIKYKNSQWYHNVVPQKSS